MNIVVLGPQGSGKGTQARLLANSYGFFYFESGDFLRDLVATNSEVKKMLDSGNLVPNDEFVTYIEAYFDEKQTWDDIIFDGFPRNMEQYALFKKWLIERHAKLDLALLLNISEKTTLNRLSARRTDPVTGNIYNLITDKPPLDIPSDRLVQRDDDKPEAIKRRLEIYKTVTIFLINELKKDMDVVEINGEQSIDAIHEEIVRAVEDHERVI